jgi:hypothetical protein
MASSPGGKPRPNVLAVLRLITSLELGQLFDRQITHLTQCDRQNCGSPAHGRETCSVG